MPTDRFIVDWWIQDEDDRKRNKYEMGEFWENESFVIKVSYDSHGYPLPLETVLGKDSESGVLFVPVPSEIQKLKKDRPELALSWRMSTRQVFTDYFQKGWSAVDLVRRQSEPDLCFYVLKQITR
ncbi:hypothetical protein [Bacillus sp. JJ1764]|uniref:hypothetical protein n=1 Tax=Bacillus sp. JJ1764 TaxID=3122964 RepID=UPI002FFD9F86